jgi:hypothetical protein
MSPKLKEQFFDYLRKPSDLSLSEAKAREQRFEALPDELFEMAEEMSPSGASFVDKLENAHKIMVEAVKLAEAWPGDGPAARIAAAAKPPASADSKPLTFAEARPDVQLAKLANEIRLSESVDYGKAMSLACERDPGLAARYKADCFGPATTSPSDRPDVELAERAKARSEKDGLDYGKAMGLELSENPALAKRYSEDRFGRAGDVSSGAVKVETPPGMRPPSPRASPLTVTRSGGRTSPATGRRGPESTGRAARPRRSNARSPVPGARSPGWVTTAHEQSSASATSCRSLRVWRASTSARRR